MTRDKNGRFAKGNPGGPGRGKKEIEESYLQAFRDNVLPEDWAEIINRAKTDAKRGDALARKWLADYLVGPPMQRQEITGEDGGPITIQVIYDVKDA